MMSRPVTAGRSTGSPPTRLSHRHVPERLACAPARGPRVGLRERAQGETGSRRVGELAARRIEVKGEPVRVAHVRGTGAHDMYGDAPEVHHRGERRARPAHEVVHVFAGARRTEAQARRPGRRAVEREVLLVEAAPEHAVGAALRGQRAIAKPWTQLRPEAVVEPRHVELRDPVVGPPHLRRIADEHAGDTGIAAGTAQRVFQPGQDPRLSSNLTRAPGAFGRILVGAQAEERRLAELVARGPLRVRDLGDELRPHPGGTAAPGRRREWTARRAQAREPRAERRQRLAGVAGADLADEPELATLIDAD